MELQNFWTRILSCISEPCCHDGTHNAPHLLSGYPVLVSRAFDNVLQVKEEGYEIAHDGYCVTVFSAPNYCDNMDNKGAYIRFNAEDMVPHFTQFSASPHPDIKPMAYANLNLFGGLM
jgi:hypothetical protein